MNLPKMLGGLQNLDEFAALARQVALDIHEAQNRLLELSMSLRDIRDVYGQLLTLQTGGVPPWYFREKGFNVVDRPTSADVPAPGTPDKGPEPPANRPTP